MSGVIRGDLFINHWDHFLSICISHKCIRQLFPLHLNTLCYGSTAIINISFSAGIVSMDVRISDDGLRVEKNNNFAAEWVPHSFIHSFIHHVYSFISLIHLSRLLNKNEWGFGPHLCTCRLNRTKAALPLTRLNGRGGRTFSIAASKRARTRRRCGDIVLDCPS